MRRGTHHAPLYRGGGEPGKEIGARGLRRVERQVTGVAWDARVAQGIGRVWGRRTREVMVRVRGSDAGQW